MGGTQSMNIWMILLLTASKTLPNYARRLSEPAENARPISLTAEEAGGELLTPEHFFVASAKDLHKKVTTSPNITTRGSSTMGYVSTVKDQGIQPDSVPTNPVQSVTPPSHSHPASPIQQPSLIEQVEYDLQLTHYEYTVTKQSVKNRLQNHVDFWENILKPSELVLSTVKYGYVIPFVHEPPSIHLKNNRSALENSTFVLEAIEELKMTGCITEVTDKPFVVNPLTVSISDSKKPRLVLDLRHVNKYVQKQKIKFEGVKEAKQYAKKGYFMLKFDLRSGYHHLNIHSTHQKYLGFSWIINGEEKFFTFSVLPFGLSSAGHIFTKVVRALVNFWRSQSFPIIVYLDDGWACDSLERCIRMSKSVLKTLLASGFLPNFEKSIFVPTQKLGWLGFIWNLESGVIEVPKTKVEKIHANIEKILLDNRSTARNMASVLGKIISLIPAFGNVCQLMTRNLCMSVCQRHTWDSYFQIPLSVVTELEFWKSNCYILPNLLICPIQQTPERVIFSDASIYASAGFIDGNVLQVAHDMFTEHEQLKSSTWRELKSVKFILESMSRQLAGKLVKIYTDNQNVVHICQVGSMKADLHELAMGIYSICIVNSITIEVEWIPRSENVQADYLSRIFDFDDWAVADNVFKMFNNRWGKLTFDRFADHKNHKVDRFNSRFWVPGTNGVDAFAFDWSGENNWIVPPVGLVCRVINHMFNCRAKGVMVVPKWKSALFWPMIWNSTENKFYSFVTDYVEFNHPKNFFLPGSDKQSIFAQSPFNSNVVVLRMDCSNIHWSE